MNSGEVRHFDGNAGGGEAINLLPLSVLLAMMAGSVKWFRQPRNKYTLLSFFVCLITSAFIGTQAHFVMRYFDAAPELQYAIAGACSYGGTTFLDAWLQLILRFAYRKLGVPFPERRRPEEQLEENHVETVE